MNPTLLPYSTVPAERIGIASPNGSLPAGLRIGTVALQVADLVASLAFYRDVIGFRLLHQQDAVAKMGVAGGDAVLLELHEQPGVRPVPRRGRLGLYHLAVLLPTRADLGRFLLNARRRGVEVGSSDHAVSEAAYLVDPDGITVEVYRDKPRSEWLVSPEGEINITLDPLDTPGVLQAAGSAPWQGLPAGTTMGHMHFYTGDLGEAEAFYHAALGFAKVSWRLSGALFVSAGGYHHHVGLNVWAAGSPVATDQDARLLSWELLLPDDASVTSAVARLEKAGYPVLQTEAGAQVTDPWGNRLRLRAEDDAAPMPGAVIN